MLMGAYGASVLVSKKHKHLMKGCSKAHSLAWNAHKMLNIPLTSSIIMIKGKDTLYNNLNVGDSG